MKIGREYGNPDDAVIRPVIAAYSPLHNLQASATYPKIYLQTSRTDDRVHPYHARAMAYQLQKLGNESYFFEKPDGGHKGVAFSEEIRKYTYWYFHLLAPAQKARKRARQENSNNRARLFHQDAQPLKKRRQDHVNCENTRAAA